MLHWLCPSRTTHQLWIVQATEEGDQLSLAVDEKIDLGFIPATIVTHPEDPLFYISTNVGEEGNSLGAIITLNADGRRLRHSRAYLGTLSS